MGQCTCTLAHRLTGDGCEVCNPSEAIYKYKQTIRDIKEENTKLREAVGRIKHICKFQTTDPPSRSPLRVASPLRCYKEIKAIVDDLAKDDDT